MHALVVTFNLKDMADEEFRKYCDDIAPSVAAIPGLIQKIWLAEPAANVYGGVYTFRTKADFEAFTKSELFHSVGTNPNLTAITAHDYGVLEGPTRITCGVGAIAV